MAIEAPSREDVLASGNLRKEKELQKKNQYDFVLLERNKL